MYTRTRTRTHTHTHTHTHSTPLIRLNKLSEETGCTIAVKAENLNPGGSVKDRAALYLIKEAEEKGGMVFALTYIHCMCVCTHIHTKRFITPGIQS